jgi:hypothetical protein
MACIDVQTSGQEFFNYIEKGRLQNDCDCICFLMFVNTHQALGLSYFLLSVLSIAVLLDLKSP